MLTALCVLWRALTVRLLSAELTCGGMLHIMQSLLNKSPFLPRGDSHSSRLMRAPASTSIPDMPFFSPSTSLTLSVSLRYALFTVLTVSFKTLKSWSSFQASFLLPSPTSCERSTKCLSSICSVSAASLFSPYFNFPSSLHHHSSLKDPLPPSSRAPSWRHSLTLSGEHQPEVIYD